MKYHHTMLRTSNMSTAVAFYSDVLGFRIKSMNTFEAPPLKITFLQAAHDAEDGPRLELVCDERLTINPSNTPKGHVSYFVSDMMAIIDRAARGGGRILQDPTITLDSKATLAIFADPDGNEIELIQVL